jgi:ABC-type Fe3+-hydroxamate transport system substrate-binding protein
MLDDLGHAVGFSRPLRRVVSLVPSLTEAIEASAPGLLVGATDWCTHPAGLDVARVRGTKNPDRAAITALRPDLVVANQEENRRLDVDRLRADGIPVWVTRIESVDEAFASLRRLLVDVVRVEEPAWLRLAQRTWADPAPPLARRAVVPVWRDPWMVVGSRTFAGDLLSRLGVTNAFGSHRDRYPRPEPGRLHDSEPDLVLLPDEPYPFAAHDGPEAFPDAPVALVSGRCLTWYGPSLAAARERLLAQIAASRPGRTHASPQSHPSLGSGDNDPGRNGDRRTPPAPT